MKPELFAPGVISTTAWEYGIAFSEDSKEIYLKRMGKNLVFCYEDGKWNEGKEVATRCVVI